MHTTAPTPSRRRPRCDLVAFLARRSPVRASRARCQPCVGPHVDDRGHALLRDIPDAAWTPVERVSSLVVAIAQGRLDRMPGRFVHAQEDWLALGERAADIVEADGRALRLTPGWPDDPVVMMIGLCSRGRYPVEPRYGAPGGPAPTWVPTGVSSSSTNAQQGARRSSSGGMPWYRVNSSPNGSSSPCACNWRSCSGVGESSSSRNISPGMRRWGGDRSPLGDMLPRSAHDTDDVQTLQHVKRLLHELLVCSGRPNVAHRWPQADCLERRRARRAAARLLIRSSFVLGPTPKVLGKFSPVARTPVRTNAPT